MAERRLAKGERLVELRSAALGTMAVILVALITAIVMLDILRTPAPAVSEEGSVESTRTLSGSVTALVPIDTTDPGSAMVMTQGQPRKPTPVEPRRFNVDSALGHVRAIEAFGVRVGGSASEAQAAAYIRDELKALGLDVRVEEFGLPNGTTSTNVIARVAGSSDAVLVLGAHMDTKPPSPGANDNASGCGALLEIATIIAADPVVPTIEFVFYGSEETPGSDPNAHHFGSRYRVSQMSAAERAKTAGMLSVDMIGYGSAFHSRTMGRGPRTLSDLLLARAKATGVRMTYLKDPGSSGWSDHEAYELAGIPSSWVEWRDDPVYHTAQDTSEHLSSARIKTAGQLVLEFAQGLDADDLAALTAR